MTNKKFYPIIGLEVHVELKTKTKMFCGCSADYFGAKPNTHVCPVCLGLPGALPVPNKKAIEWCVMIGLALNCQTPLISKFDRKNYFYPDLPKGYQISQYDQPFAVNGHIVIARSEETKQSQSKEIATRTTFVRNDSKKKVIRIRRVHMEEDTAKLIHKFQSQISHRGQSGYGSSATNLKTQNHKGYSLIDFNRSGVPLVEIVTEPDFASAREVLEYLKKLQQIVRYLEVSNADMEKGEMRLEPNISLIMNDKGVKIKKKLPNYKVEVKNINSFRYVERAVNYEIERQKKILESGKIPLQETRGWNEEKHVTISQRTKEEAHDYRYFPEPDIPPIHWTKYQISNIKRQIGELPDEKFTRFQKDYNLSSYDSDVLTKEKGKADYFEEAVTVNNELRIKNHEYTQVKTIANWVINKKVNIESILPAKLIEEIISASKMSHIDEKELQKLVKNVFGKNPKAVGDYKKGKTEVIGFLIGMVRRSIQEPADTTQIKTVIEKLLRIH